MKTAERGLKKPPAVWSWICDQTGAPPPRVDTASMPTQTGNPQNSRTIFKLIVITIIKSVFDFVLRVTLICVMYKKIINTQR